MQMDVQGIQRIILNKQEYSTFFRMLHARRWVRGLNECWNVALDQDKSQQAETEEEKTTIVVTVAQNFCQVASWLSSVVVEKRKKRNSINARNKMNESRKRNFTFSVKI